MIRSFIKITSRFIKLIWPVNRYPTVYLHRFSFCYCSVMKTEFNRFSAFWLISTEDWVHLSFYEVHYHLLSHRNYHLTVTQPQKFKSHLLSTPKLSIAEAPISRFQVKKIQVLYSIINQCFRFVFTDVKSRFHSTVHDIQ